VGLKWHAANRIAHTSPAAAQRVALRARRLFGRIGRLYMAMSIGFWFPMALATVRDGSCD
jgi:hypothetical protein